MGRRSVSPKNWSARLTLESLMRASAWTRASSLFEDDGLAGLNLVMHDYALRGFGCISNATSKKLNVEHDSSTS